MVRRARIAALVLACAGPVIVVVACRSHADDAAHACAAEDDCVDAKRDGAVESDSEVESDSGVVDAPVSDSAAVPDCATTFAVSADLAVPAPSGGNSQVQPAVAFDGTNYLLVWGEGPPPGSNWVVKATRISPTGAVLDDPPLTVSGGTSVDARAAFNGTDYLVVWESGPSGGNTGISGGRVSPAGTIRDPGGFTIIAPSNSYLPDVACGIGQCLVSWNHQSSTQIQASRVDSSGTVLDTPPLLLATTSGPAPGLKPRVDFDGADYGVAWVDTSVDGGVFWSSVSTTGQASPRASRVARRPFLSLGLAFDGEQRLLVWTAQGGGGLQGLFGRVSKDGGVLDPNGLLLADAGSCAEWPSVAFDGREFVSVWEDSDGGFTGRLLGVRICGGAVATPFTVVDPITTSNGRESFFTEMASDRKGNSLVAYRVCGGGINCRVHARLVSAQ